MYFATPIDYDKVMKKIPYGKVITVGKIREYFAKLSGEDFTEPIKAGIFVSIAAWASDQRSEGETSYWRTLKANGELNAKYPDGIEAQKEKLEFNYPILKNHCFFKASRLFSVQALSSSLAKRTEMEISEKPDKLPDVLEEDGYPDVQAFIAVYSKAEGKQRNQPERN